MPSTTRSGPVLPTQPNNLAPQPGPPTNQTEGYNTRKKSYKYSNTKAPYIPPPPRPVKRQLPPTSVACKKQRLDTDSSNENRNTNATLSSYGDREMCAVGSEIEHSRGEDTADSIVDSLGGDNQQTNVSNTNYLPTLPHTSNLLHNPLSEDPSNVGVELLPESEPHETTNRIEEFVTTTGLPPAVAPLPQTGSTQEPGSQTWVRPGISKFPESTKSKLMFYLSNLGTTDFTCNTSSSTSTLNFTTPRRPARSVGLTTPTVVIFATPPDWARFDAEQGAHFPSVSSTAIQPFNWPSARIEDVDSDAPLQQHSPPGGNHSSSLGNLSIHAHNFDTGDSAEITSALSKTPTSRSDSNFGTSSPERQIAASWEASMGSSTHVQPTALTVRPSTSNFSRMYNAIKQTLPPAPPSATQSSTPHNLSTVMVRASSFPANNVASVLTPGTASRSSSVSRIGGLHSRAGSVTRANSLARDDRSFREGSSTRDTPAPVTSVSASNAQTQPLRSLRQRDFQYDQVAFMSAMKKRWHWYLIADNLFPMHTSVALELCAQYAEQTMEVSCVDCGITHTALGFVRRKESAIRNLFQNGLLSIVEEAYNVNPDTTEKLNELVSQSNYVYVEYDVTTKKVSGCYRHPCLVRVLKTILFTKHKRGRPIGVSFVSELIGGKHPTDVTEQPGGAGVTAPMIALACTLVLYALQSIRAGDTSQRLGTRKGKPLHFSEKKYSGPYRNFITKLQQYNRLDELRKAYLEEVMEEYLRVHVNSNEESDVDIEVDDETHSDGD
ncbi:hypothetical protein FRC11_010186 [Ceratobasidium sp. 423]|nr:hypothetical protein FRC11_010186 [Ceratobasidium sp. 423]